MTPLYTFKLVRQSSVREPLAKMNSPAASAALARQAIGESAIEVFLAIGLNSTGKVLGIFEVARGTYDSCAVDPRVLFAGLLNMGPVSGFVLAHNHPSGDPTPSLHDVSITRQLAEGGKLLGMRLLDHVVVTETEAFASLLEKGLLNT